MLKLPQQSPMKRQHIPCSSGTSRVAESQIVNFRCVGSDLAELPVDRKWSGVTPDRPRGHSPGGSKLDWNPSRRGRSGQEAFQVGQKWFGGPPGGPGVVQRTSRWTGKGLKALLVGQNLAGALPEGWKWAVGLSVVQKWSAGPPGGLEVVQRPPRWAGSVPGPHGGSKVDRRPFRWVGSDPDTLPVDQKLSGGPLGGLEVVHWPC